MSHRVTDEMVDAFRRAYREWWKAATPIPLGEAVSVERDAVVAGLRAAFGVPVPDPCPTCSPPYRETVGMVCQTCGTDYAPEEGQA